MALVSPLRSALSSAGQGLNPLAEHLVEPDHGVDHALLDGGPLVFGVAITAALHIFDCRAFLPRFSTPDQRCAKFGFDRRPLRFQRGIAGRIIADPQLGMA